MKIDGRDVNIRSHNVRTSAGLEKLPEINQKRTSHLGLPPTPFKKNRKISVSGQQNKSIVIQNSNISPLQMLPQS